MLHQLIRKQFNNSLKLSRSAFFNRILPIQNPLDLKNGGFKKRWKYSNNNKTNRYVFLCRPEHYPWEIDNIKITPHPPTSQRSIIIKLITTESLNSQIKEELKIKFKSICSIEDIIGSHCNLNR